MVPKPKASKREVTIEFTSDQNDKAHGHVNGGGNLPKRDFFGLPPNVEERLLKRIITDASRDNFIGVFEDIVSDVQLPISTSTQNTAITGALFDDDDIL